MTSFSGALDRVRRAVQALAGRGRITVSDDTGPAQRLQVKLGPLEVRDTTPRLAEFGFSSRPPAGTDAVLLFLSGDRSNGVVIATGHQASRPRSLEEGETIVYDLFGKFIRLTKDGGIVIEANGSPVTVNNAAEVVVHASARVLLDTPMVKTTGSVVVGNGASGSFSTPTGAVVTVQDGIITNIT
ncbi:phage baseplate assembly protein V [Luteibacter yeojuensis]|uniref:Phage baseplate assembly protein V n=1 Tax=Luteibacter yeojuensis TaxID=345309 RepID=A0A7X5TPE6_9GAMM|nr:phage baseplate assembly protein V [Luteibacter yeojuensis]NID15376.1 phage baseplate assembly protein V [Luteibacter yeojuensis]